MSTHASAFIVGATIVIGIAIRDVAGNYYDPTTSVKHTVIDPDGIVAVNNQAMTKDGVGIYHADYTATKVGAYAIWTWCLNGTRMTPAHCTAMVGHPAT